MSKPTINQQVIASEQDLSIEEKLQLVNQAIDNIDEVEVVSPLAAKPLAPVDPAGQFVCFGCE